MREGIGDTGPLPVEGAPYPNTVRIAGVIWVVFGALILLNAALNVVLNLGAGAAGGPPGGGICPLLVAALFGAAFAHVGLQSLRGTARDTLGNGIGSIVIGLLNAGFGTL